MSIRLYTIGFTKKSAEEFFGKIKDAGIRVVLDVRLNNSSQLAGFAKKDDLIFFLKNLCNSHYKHLPLLAPTKEILDNYKKKRIDWAEYEEEFSRVIEDRGIEHLVTSEELDRACLLCSEPTAEKCHRRLVAEYFKTKFSDLEIVHL